MFHGSIVALVTPMDSAGQLDLSAWHQLIQWHLDAGTQALVVAGTTGESACLSSTEFQQLLESAVSLAGGKVPVIAGTGSSCTQSTIERTQLAARLGADGALVVTPYYNRPQQDGLEAHYLALAEAVELPIVLYNVPARTGVDLLPATVARLARHPRIVAFKEAQAGAQRWHELRQSVAGRIALLSGDDPSCAFSMLHGGSGVISVVANAAPAAMAELSRLALAGATEAATALDRRLQPLYQLASLGGNPAGIKWSLWQSQRIQRGIRLPLTWLNPDLEAQATALYQSVSDLIAQR